MCSHKYNPQTNTNIYDNERMGYALLTSTFDKTYNHMIILTQ